MGKFYKQRSESLELRIMRYLFLRMKLSAKEVKHYFNLVKGYQGELKFDEFSTCLTNNWVILNDLLLECNNTVFQIDAMLLSEDKLYLIEVKNFEGDYYIEGDRWYSITKKEIKNPLLQLQRCESLLRQLLQDLGIKEVCIESYVVFVNSEFHLYHASMDLPIIFPTQLNRFFKKIDNKPPFIEKGQKQFAEKLVSLLITDFPYSRLPKYSYENLNKGIYCLGCHSFSDEQQKEFIVCERCGTHENVEASLYLLAFEGSNPISL